MLASIVEMMAAFIVVTIVCNCVLDPVIAWLRPKPDTTNTPRWWISSRS